MITRIALVYLCMLLPVAADDTMGAAPPSWRCLPEETVFALHAPAAKNFLDTLRSRTEFGRLFLAESRLGKLDKVLAEVTDGDWSEFKSALEESQLSLADLPRLLSGASGLGVVAEPVGSGEHIFVALAWFEAEGDLGDRLLQILLTKLEEQDLNSPESVRRLDVKIASQEVIQLTVPNLGTDVPTIGELPADFFEWTEEQREKYWDDYRARVANAKKVVQDVAHVWICRRGKRFVLGFTLPDNEERIRAARNSGDENPDLDALTHREQATGVYARFLASHESPPESGFAARILANSDLNSDLGAGQVAMECFVDLQRLVGVLAPALDPEARQIVNLLALGSIRMAGLRVGLDGSSLRNNLVIQCPSPRKGLMALLDQPPLPVSPPAWVSKDVVSYGHLSVDLAATYQRIKTLAGDHFGAEATTEFDRSEMMAAGMIGLEIPRILASLAPGWRMMSFEPSVTESAQEPQRLAMVAEVRDAEVWKTLFARIKPMLGGLAAQGIELVADEQGFQGVRVEADGQHVALLFDEHHLVIAVGQNISDVTLARLRDAPTEGDRLEASGVIARAKALMPPHASILYQVVDNSRYLKSILESLQPLLQALAIEDAKVNALMSLFPSATEMAQAFGVAVSQGYFNEQGLILESISELPLAKD